jgi:hypothetical protein
MKGLDRPQRNIERLGDFLVFELVVMPHDENRALALGQSVYTARQDVFEIAGLLGSLLSPVGNVQLVHGFFAYQLAASAVMLAVIIDAEIFGDLEQPPFEIPAFLERIDLEINAEEGLLDEVEGVLLVAEEGIGQDEDFFLIHPGQRHESLSVSFLDSLNQSPGVVMVDGLDPFH